MLTKLTNIKGTDAFDAFDWVGAPLKRFNLVYGWNGSGKTTASRVLALLEKRAVHLPDLSGVQFSVGTVAGPTISERDLASHALEIRVFNKDFIEDNLAFNDGMAKKIVILGEANIQIQRDIDQLSADKATITADLTAQDAAFTKAEKIVVGALTTAGRDVTKQFGNTPLASDAYYGRSYNKTKVERALADEVVSESSAERQILEPNALDALRESIKSERGTLPVGEAEVLPFKALFEGAASLLETNPAVTSRDDLLTDAGLRDWTEKGYHLHRDRESTECLFCGSGMSPDVLQNLAGFFTDELSALKSRIDAAIKEAGSTLSGLPSEANELPDLFPDLVLGYQTARSLIEASGQTIRTALDELLLALKEKREKVHDASSRSLPAYPESAVEGINSGLKATAEIIRQHNQRASATDVERVAAAKQIEQHVIAKVLKDRGYFDAKRDMTAAAATTASLKERLATVDKELGSKQAALQDAKIAIDKINALLTEFFGEGQLYLEPVDLGSAKGGYSLCSRGKVAKRLSEGEKSVLALIYFLVKLDEAGCDKPNCVVVIDDPVDSQDSVFLFRHLGF